MANLYLSGELDQFQPESGEKVRTSAAIFLRNEKWRGNGGFVETNISLRKRPLVIVGSAYPSSHEKFELVESVDSALKAEGIKTGRIGVGWPRNWWHYANGIYIPAQDWRTTQYSQGESHIGNGGFVISGDDFHIISKASETYGNTKNVEEEYKLATGVKNIWTLPYMVGSGSKDIDLFINYIPWMKLFVVDSEYYRKNSRDIDGIAQIVGGVIIKTEQKYGPNFMLYDFSGDRFILSLDGDVADQLKERGAKVIEVATDDKDSLLKDFGGVRCVTNVLHDESLLPLVSQHNEVTKVYNENHPGFV